MSHYNHQHNSPCSQICVYCSNFFNQDFAQTFTTTSTPATARRAFSFGEGAEQWQHKESPSFRLHHVIVEDEDATKVSKGCRSYMGLDAVLREVEKNKNLAKFEEIKFETENLLNAEFSTAEQREGNKYLSNKIIRK